MDCNRCKKRSLTHIANDVFKDARIAKKWLHRDDVAGLNGIKPIDAIARADADHLAIVKQVYVSAMKDESLLERESAEDRKKRFFKTSQLVFNISANDARDWIKNYQNTLSSADTTAVLQKRIIELQKL